MPTHKNRVGPIGWGLLVLIASTIAYLSVLSPGNSTVPSTLTRIQSSGLVRIGYANEAPYGYLDSGTGRITGEAPEIAKTILRRMGATKIEPVVTEFGALIPGLKAGRFDLIAAGMYITPQRAKEIDFSNPTYAIGEAFLVRSGNPLDLHSFEDVIEHDSARLAVMGGSVEHGYARELGVPEDRIVIFPDYPSAVEGVKTGRVDALAATLLTINDLLKKSDDPGLSLAVPFQDPVIGGKSVTGYGAFGFRKSDGDFREEFNQQLSKFIGTNEHLDLVEPFGFSEKTLPGDVSAQDLITR